MKKTSLMILAVAASFCLGFEVKDFITMKTNDETKMKIVTGIGGIFFKCKDPNKMIEWYQTHLGLNTNQNGAVFEWYQGADSTKNGFTQWSPFDEKSN